MHAALHYLPLPPNHPLSTERLIARDYYISAISHLLPSQLNAVVVRRERDKECKEKTARPALVLIADWLGGRGLYQIWQGNEASRGGALLNSNSLLDLDQNSLDVAFAVDVDLEKLLLKKTPKDQKWEACVFNDIWSLQPTVHFATLQSCKIY